jgi:hypothetical protein
MQSDDLQRNVVRLRPRLQMTLLSPVEPNPAQLLQDEEIDRIRAELREVAEQLRRAGRKLAAIEAIEGIDAAAIRTATTHVRLLCRSSGYTLEEGDEPPPALGEIVETGDELFVVDRLAPSPLPGDSRRCAVLVPR